MDPESKLAPRMATARDLGTAYGLYLGARHAEDVLFNEAAKEAAHAQLEAAGLCVCPTKPVSTPVGALLDDADAILKSVLDEDATVPGATIAAESGRES